MTRTRKQPAATRLPATCRACNQTGRITASRGDLGVLYACQCGNTIFVAWSDLTHAQRTQFDGTASDQKEAALSVLELPTKPREGGGTPMRARVLLIGHPKVGKTTTAASWAPEKTLILDTHSGTKLLAGEHFVVDVDSFDDFTKAVDLIAKGGHPFETVVIDTVDDIYKFTDAHAAQKSNKVAAGLVEFGKGTAEAEALFRREVNRLLALPIGVWFLGHAEDMQVDNQVRFVPKLDRRVRTFVTGASDYVWFAERIGTRRVVHTQPSSRFEAGSRTVMPETVDLDARKLYAAMHAGLSGNTQPAEPEPTQEPVEAVAA